MNGMILRLPGSDSGIDEIRVEYDKDESEIHISQIDTDIVLHKDKLQGLINALYAVQNLIELQKKDDIQYEIRVSKGFQE